jgi:predicted Zn-dependent protease
VSPVRGTSPACAVLAVAALALGSVRASGQQPAPSPVIQAMRSELDRSVRAFARQPTPTFFVSYEITDAQALTITGSFGTITGNRRSHRRALTVDVRVGDPKFDNTHQVRGGFPGFADFLNFADGETAVPIDDDTAAIRAALWSETDRRYRRAVQQLSWLKTNAAVAVQADDTSPDFSAEPPERYAEVVASLAVDPASWEAKVRRYTLPFARYGDIYDAQAAFDATVETRWYVNSEGSVVQTSQPVYRLSLSAYAKADDGMELPRYETFTAFDPGGLPDDAAVLRAVQRMIDDLHALRRAPIVDPYTGPAILSGRASAVFFHEVFGHRVEGHRQKREDEGQTFKADVHQRVLPEGFSVYADPTLRRIGSTDLAGSYRFDDEGVAARRVTVVDNGTLENFLMSRSPIEGFAHSNGHGRGQMGFVPVARQSNLIVRVAQPRTREALRRMLIEAIHREHKPFGLLFDDIEGGFTITQRDVPNAFQVLPVMVYRVWPDGREELVRGVDFVGTPLTAFSRIVAADDETAVFNGMCGAESGFVPVSAVSPGVFVAQVEVQKKSSSPERPPVLPPPFAVPGAAPHDRP